MRTARKAGADARSSAATPTAEQRAQTASPVVTPAAVETPPRRPQSKAFLKVRAVSGPGVTIRITETRRNAPTSILNLVAPSGGEVRRALSEPGSALFAEPGS